MLCIEKGTIRMQSGTFSGSVFHPAYCLIKWPVLLTVLGHSTNSKYIPQHCFLSLTAFSVQLFLRTTRNVVVFNVGIELVSHKNGREDHIIVTGIVLLLLHFSQQMHAYIISKSLSAHCRVIYHFHWFTCLQNKTWNSLKNQNGLFPIYQRLSWTMYCDVYYMYFHSDNCTFSLLEI